MKLKKIYSHFICYLTLVAFMGIIGIEISSHSFSDHKKTEVSSKKRDASSDLNLAFEEERDADDYFDLSFLSVLLFNSISPAIFQINNYLKYCEVLKTKTKFLKDPLFISIRTLRL